MQLRKTKTDKKDAVVIARFLLANGNTLLQRATPSFDFGSSGSFSRQRESLVDEMTSLKIEIRAAPEYHHCPELEHMVGIFTTVYSQAFAAISFRKWHLRDKDIGQLSQTLIADFLWS